MLCRLFFQIYIKIKLKLLKLTSLKDIKEQIIKIKTDITDIDIAESKIQLISLQLNPREKEGTNRTQEREKEPTELKREKEPTELKKREKEPTELKREREKEPTEPKKGRRNLPNPREREGTN